MSKVGRSAVSIAALGVAAAVGGVAATQPAAITTPLVDLAALIVVGSSTHPDGTGNENFFGGKFETEPEVDVTPTNRTERIQDDEYADETLQDEPELTESQTDGDSEGPAAEDADDTDDAGNPSATDSTDAASDDGAAE